MNFLLIILLFVAVFCRAIKESCEGDSEVLVCTFEGLFRQMKDETVRRIVVNRWVSGMIDLSSSSSLETVIDLSGMLSCSNLITNGQMKLQTEQNVLTCEPQETSIAPMTIISSETTDSSQTQHEIISGHSLTTAESKSDHISTTDRNYIIIGVCTFVVILMVIGFPLLYKSRRQRQQQGVHNIEVGTLSVPSVSSSGSSVIHFDASSRKYVSPRKFD